MIAVDTNLLVYAVDAQAGSRHDTARTTLDSLLAADRLVLPAQVLAEFVHVVTRKLRLPFTAATQFTERWSRFARTVSYDAHDVGSAAALATGARIAFFDALILAVCERAGAEALLSEDLQPGRPYGKVMVLDPFDAKTAKRIKIV